MVYNRIRFSGVDEYAVTQFGAFEPFKIIGDWVAGW